jgi:hypothetical protein
MRSCAALALFPFRSVTTMDEYHRSVLILFRHYMLCHYTFMAFSSRLANCMAVTKEKGRAMSATITCLSLTADDPWCREHYCFHVYNRRDKNMVETHHRWLCLLTRTQVSALLFSLRLMATALCPALCKFVVFVF